MTTKPNRYFTLIGLLLFLLLCLVPNGRAQQVHGLSQTPGQSYQMGLTWDPWTATSPASSSAFSVVGLHYFTVSWSVFGTVSGCIVTLDGNPGNGTFSTGTLLSSQTCTAPGSFTTTSAVNSYQGKLTPTITGSGSVIFTVTGYDLNPATNGAAGAVSVTSPLDGSGYVNIDCKTGCAGGNPNGQAAMAASAPVVIASNQSAIPASQSGTWNVRAQDGSGNALTSNSTTYTAKFALDNNLLGTLGTAFTTPGFVDVKGADGNVFVRQTTGSNLHVQVDTGPATQAVTESGTWNVRAQDGAGNALTSNSTTYTAKFGLDNNLLGTLGTAFSTPGKIDVIGTVTANAGTGTFASSDAADAVTGAAVPAKGMVVAGKNGSGNTQDVATDASGNVGVNIQNVTATASQNVTASQCAVVAVGGGSLVSIAVTGTWGGTLQPKTSVDGTNYNNAVVFPTFPTGASQSTITANNTFVLLPLGAQNAEVCGNTVTSGTAVVTVNATPGTGQQLNNVALWAGALLGAPSNYGTSPGGVTVPGVNAFITNTVTVVGANTPADAAATPADAVHVQSWPMGWNGATSDRLRTAGVGNAVAATGILAAAAYCEYLSSLPTLTTGTYGALQCDAGGQLRLSSDMPGTVPGTPANSNNLIGLMVNSTAPAPTNGQQVPAQANGQGDLYINFRNSCGSSTNLSSVALNASTTSAVQLVALAAAKKITVCGFIVIGGGTTPTLSLVYGTGSNCGTGQTTLMGAIPLSTTTPTIALGGPIGLVPSGDALCTLLAGTSPTAVGVLSYVQASN